MSMSSSCSVMTCSRVSRLTAPSHCYVNTASFVSTFPTCMDISFTANFSSLISWKTIAAVAVVLSAAASSGVLSRGRISCEGEAVKRIQKGLHSVCTQTASRPSSAERNFQYLSQTTICYCSFDEKQMRKAILKMTLEDNHK